VLALRRSILTEKVSRRGYHLSREYAIDPLEILFVREVMRRNIVALRADASEALDESLRGDLPRRPQLLYPVVDDEYSLVGVMRHNDLQRVMAEGEAGERSRLTADVLRRDPAVAYPDEPLRVVVYRMAETGLTRFPVIERGSRKLLGMIGLSDLLTARVRNLEAERRRQRVLPVRLVLPRAWRRRRSVEAA
jgi:CBS domain-containing protein